MTLFPSSRSRARSSWGQVLLRRSIRPSRGRGVSRIDRRLGYWLWGSLALGRSQQVYMHIGELERVCLSAYILAPPPKALNHRPG